MEEKIELNEQDLKDLSIEDLVDTEIALINLENSIEQTLDECKDEE